MKNIIILLALTIFTSSAGSAEICNILVAATESNTVGDILLDEATGHWDIGDASTNKRTDKLKDGAWSYFLGYADYGYNGLLTLQTDESAAGSPTGSPGCDCGGHHQRDGTSWGLCGPDQFCRSSERLAD